MLKTITHLLSLIRFSHTLFALPFAMMAAVMAWWLVGIDYHTDPPYGINSEQSVFIAIDLGIFSTGYWKPPIATARQYQLECFLYAIRWQELVGILLCMVFARSAAMAFNRLADQKIDAKNPRTADRHLPAGILSTPMVRLFAIVCAGMFVASTLMFLPNRLPLYLSLPVLLFLFGYSYAKRFTSLAHFWLGAALAMSPIAAWIAIRGDVVLQRPEDLLPALTLGGAVLAWVAGFDILYACQDHEFDRQAKLHSIPVALGVPGALRLAAICHAVTVVFLAILPVVYPPLGAIYWAGIATVAVLLLYEHWLVKPNDLDRVNVAFFNVNAVISLGLLVVTCVDLLVV